MSAWQPTLSRPNAHFLRTQVGLPTSSSEKLSAHRPAKSNLVRIPVVRGMNIASSYLGDWLIEM